MLLVFVIYSLCGEKNDREHRKKFITIELVVLVGEASKPIGELRQKKKKKMLPK